MKITKTANIAKLKKTIKELANEGCNVCPECGEDRSFLSYLQDGICNKGISSGLEKTWIKGFFKMRSMKCDCYKCYTCGAEWESEPYEWCF